MTEPVCRTCYVNTLTVAERLQLVAEPVTMPIHYCAEHEEQQRVIQSLFDRGVVVWQGSTTGRFPHYEGKRMLEPKDDPDVNSWESEGGR